MRLEFGGSDVISFDNDGGYFWEGVIRVEIYMMRSYIRIRENS